MDAAHGRAPLPGRVRAARRATEVFDSKPGAWAARRRKFRGGHPPFSLPGSMDRLERGEPPRESTADHRQQPVSDRAQCESAASSVACVGATAGASFTGLATTLRL